MQTNAPKPLEHPHHASLRSGAAARATGFPGGGSTSQSRAPLDDDAAPSPRGSAPAAGWAEFGGVRARGVLECIDLAHEADRLDTGVWFVSAHFDGPGRAWRFAEVVWDETVAGDAAHPSAHAQPSGTEQSGAPAHPHDDVVVPRVPWASPSDYPGAGWAGPHPDEWTSSATASQYKDGVSQIRALIADGDVYQVNLCRVLSAPLSGGSSAADVGPDAFALGRALAAGNPAPYAGVIHVPASPGIDPVWIVSASPELFLERDGRTLRSGPIKGTAPSEAELLPKDSAENVMITDLVRNDLHVVCEPETVRVERLLALEHHPGLVHLVSTVSGELADSQPSEGESRGEWARILGATFPPASVSGAPKEAALGVIEGLERAGRGPYCGAIGWIDGDRDLASLAVGIRTFWWSDGRLHFGTGAGITWGSDPETEWQETELKARRLVGLTAPRSGGAT